MHLEPPVNRFSEAAAIEEWIEELQRLKEDPELQEEEHQRDIQRHLNDARTWLAWDLHRRVMEEGEDVAEVLREVGAETREPGDPPPEESGSGDPA